MGRVSKPQALHNQQPEPSHSHLSTETPLHHLVQVSEPQIQRFDEIIEPQLHQPEESTARPTQVPIYIQPQVYIQPQIQVPQAGYVQPQDPGFQTYHAQDYQPPVMCPPQPMYAQYRHGWRTGLFDCMDDPENAIITLCCPCVTFGQVAEIIDNGRTSCETAGCIYTAIAVCIAVPCIYSFTYRTKLRAQFGLDESPAPDCITHLCCEYCALCQEYRELNHRGLNPSAGWMNVSKNQNMRQQQGMVPPAYQTMR